MITYLPSHLLLVVSCLTVVTIALTNFDDWQHQRVALQDVSIHFRYAGSGPPLLLVHGNPQFSLTWRIIGPLLAENFTVIAPDNRGAGDSSLAPDGNYSSVASAQDLKGVLDFLNITSTYVFAHDKGCGPASALAAGYPGLVKRLGVSEYALPGFGYEAQQAPQSYWDLYQSWQLAFFSVPDAAEFFVSGKERQMLEWYFWHTSYSGPTAFPSEVIERYASSISKPGFLRALFGPFDNKAIAADASFFTGTIRRNPLSIPLLALGGEAGVSSRMALLWKNISSSLKADVVPKAGHWIADENPSWVAARILKFFTDDTTPIRAIDLSYLKDKVTLTVGSLGTLDNAHLAGII